LTVWESARNPDQEDGTMLAEFSILPVGQGAHLSDQIANVLRLVDESGLPYRLHAMGTEVEGSWDEVIGLIRRCHERLSEKNERLITTIKIDDFQGRTGMLEDKVASVERKIGQSLKR
jgi:uncharacterized protein (TIGR00106 family)